MKTNVPTPGMRILCRDAEWMVTRVTPTDPGNQHFSLECTGADDLVRGHEAAFLTQLEDITPVDPRETQLVPDDSPGFRRARLFLEAQLRQMPSTELDAQPDGLGAFKPMKYQLDAVRKALGQIRPRLLLADAVGLGKTIEIGMILAELIARGRANRILVLAKKATLTQFQSELWNRFAIPLVRLDSTNIARLRLRIPTSKNPFEVFHRAIISVDTLKDAGRYRPFLERTRWDVVIIDEAHNVAGASVPERHQSYKLARLLARSTDSLILATATPHNGKRETFARLISLLDPSAIPDPRLREYAAEDVAPFFLMRFKEDVRAEAGAQFAERQVIPLAQTTSDATPEEEAIYALLGKLRSVVKESKSGNDLLQWGLYKRFLSSPEAFASTAKKVRETLTAKDAEHSCLPVLKQLEAAAARLTIRASSRFQLLAKHLRELGWDGSPRSPRVLIFTESTVTQAALADALAEDFSLDYSEKFDAQPAQVLATIHGGFPDTLLSATIESFGTGSSPMRLLLATDVASEGVNLHHECHHIIHYDLPWSIITLIQRNGRIDRFGQSRTPFLRYLMVKTREGLLAGDIEIFERLVGKVEEINRSTRTGESVLRLYDPEQEEKYIAEKGMLAGDTDVLARAESSRWNDEAAGLEELLKAAQAAADPAFLASLASAVIAPTPTAEPLAPEAGRLRLYPDRDFLVQSYDFLRTSEVGQRHSYLPLETTPDQILLTAPHDLRRRLGAPGVQGDLILGGNAIPDEAWPEHGRFHLTHLPARVQAAIESAFHTTGFWAGEQLCCETHPIMRWLVERLAMLLPRGAAPLVTSPKLEPGEKCFCFIGQVSSQAGSPLITDGHAITFGHDGKWRHRSLRDALAAAGFENLTNTGHRNDFNSGAMRALVIAAVEHSLKHLRQLSDQRRQRIRPLLDREERRLNAWYLKRKSLQLDFGKEFASDTKRSRKLADDIAEMDRYVEDRNRNWRDAHYLAALEPTTRLVLVIESNR